jgi:MFS family permease
VGQRNVLKSLGELPGGVGLFSIALLNTVTEFAAWVAVLIVAFEQGGAAESGRAAAIQLIPAAFAAPFVAAAGDRFPRHRVIQVAMAAVALTTLGIAALLHFEQSLVLVYLLAAVLAMALISVPTALASLLVHHARTPDQLTSLNVLATIVRSVGILVGPLVAAIALSIVTPAWLFVGLSVAALGALVAVVVFVAEDDRAHARLRIRDVATDSMAGLRYVVATSPVRRIIVFLAIGQVILGTLDVILVSVAFEQLGRGGGTAAMLSACLAAGAVAASLTATRFIGRVELSWLALGGGLLMTIPVIALDQFALLVPVVSIVAIIGVGSAFEDIGGLTLLQRVGSERMTSRVFGILNSCSLAACAVGALVAGAFIERLSALTAFAIIGVTGAVAMVVCGSRLISVDRAIDDVDPARIDELRLVPFLAPLPLPTLERLVRTSELRTCPPGSALIVQGMVEHEFFVLLAGSIVVTADGVTIREGSAPDYVGEIALVRDVARTAGVAAITECSVLVIGREAFLESISLTSSSRLSAETVAGTRLADAAGMQRPIDVDVELDVDVDGEIELNYE